METPVPVQFKSERGLPSRWLVLFTLAVATAHADVAAIRELIRGGRFAEAAAVCDRELISAPASPALWTLKGLALRGAGDGPQSLAAFRSALKFDPRYPPALQAAAQLEFDSRHPRARSTLETSLLLDPANATAHALLGELAFERQDCPAVLQHYANSAKATDVRWRVGVCSFLLEQWPAAAVEFAALLALREHGPTRFNLAITHWRAGNPAATLEVLGNLDDPDSLSLRAAALRATKQVPQALELLQSAIERYPRDERLLLDLGLLCLDQSAIELGISVLEAAVARLPSSVRLHTALGVFHVRAGRFEQGDASFQAAIRLAPGTGMGQVATASTLMQMGLAEDAVKLLRSLPLNQPMVALTLARALVLKNATAAERAEAKQLLARVISREPSLAAARSLLGKVHAQDGENAPAVQQLEAALRLDPTDRTAVFQLLTLYRKSGRTADANRLSTRLRQLLAQEKSDDIEAQRYPLSRKEDR